MLLADLVAASDGVATTRSRNAKRDLIAAAIGSMSDEELAVGVAYLSGEMPQGRIGLGYATVYGATAEPASTACLTVADVDTALTAIKTTTGAGSKAARSARLDALLASATAAEQRFLRRLILRELRQGALEGVMGEAIAVANDVPAAAVRRAAMVGGDLTSVALAARAGIAALSEFRIEVGRPVQPMLAQTAEDVAEALARHSPAIVETKFDGARVQVHKQGDQVWVFTRRLRDVTADLPDVVASARLVTSHQAILDGEAIALDSRGRPLPFQATMSRFGSAATETADAALNVFFFDVLLLDGEETISLPAAERWELLTSAVPANMLPPHAAIQDAASAGALLERALAGGHEGIMVKDLTASYAAGRRGAGWLKVKPAHTLDLVVLAVEWGSGRRQGWLSNLHLGARDPGSEGFVMLGKTFKGLTDQMLEWQTTRFLDLETHRDERVVYVRPEQVVEIAFDGIQASPRYPGGMALRFARVKGYREDKPAAAADTIEIVRAIFERA